MARTFTVGWQSKPLPPLVGGGLMVLVGLGLSIGGWTWRQNLSDFLAHSARAQGTVVNVERGTNSNSHFPVFVFHDPQGNEFEVRSQYSNEQLKRGDRVTVAYDRSSPYDAVVLGTSSLSMAPLLLIGLGMAFAIGGLSLGWGQYKYEKKHGRNESAS